MNTIDRRGLGLLALCLLAALGGGCGEPERNGVTIEGGDLPARQASAGHGALLVVDGISVTVDGTIDLRVPTGVPVQALDGGDLRLPSPSPSSKVLVDGGPLDVIEGQLFVSTVAYGEVSPGDEVRIGRDGVSVNGRWRGELPDQEHPEG